MIFANLSDKEKRCFCSLLMAAVCEDEHINETDIDWLLKYRIELDVADISSDISYEQAASWLEKHCEPRTKRSILLELAATLYNDDTLTGEENELLSDLARRFKIKNLKEYIQVGKKLGAAYNSTYDLFKDLF